MLRYFISPTLPINWSEPIWNIRILLQEKRSVKSTASDRSKNDSEASKNLEEERKKYLELQKELDLQVMLTYSYKL